MAKDLFSQRSDLYSRYRPTYPDELYEYILSFVKEKNIAWDCATGNGQAAVKLADHFKKVIATDISSMQLEKAMQKQNIEYIVSAAESTPFDDNTFDLVTVAQAYHWFDWKKFKSEATRVCRDNAVVAVWVYWDHTTGDKKIDEIVRDFYHNVVGSYWEPERKHVENKFHDVEFDFDPLPEKEFTIMVEWTRNDLIGFISTWSALQKYIRENGYSPIPLLQEKIETVWNANEKKTVKFPLYLKLGRIQK